MFEIDENNLPVLTTRQALLALDLQNDLVSTGSLLYSSTPPDLVETIVNIAPHFRPVGNVIWVRSIFERSRPVNLPRGESEHVITDNELVMTRQGEYRARLYPKRSQKLRDLHSQMSLMNGRDVEDPSNLEVDEEEGEAARETFLTEEPGHEADIVRNGTVGINFHQAVVSVLDAKTDLIFSKTHYSAFKDGSLVQILRARFVTELYICGALTNISVFATAMDAARHGYSITIIEDCIGYRCKARHDEALRQLVDVTGCGLIKSEDLIKELKRKSEKSKTKKPLPTFNPTFNPRTRKSDLSLENLMSKLDLKRDFSVASKPAKPQPAVSQGHNSKETKLVGSTSNTTSSERPSNHVDKAISTAPSKMLPEARASPESRSSNDSTSTLEATTPIQAESQVKPRERVKTKIKTRHRTPESSNGSASQPNTSTPEAKIKPVAQEDGQPSAGIRKSSSIVTARKEGYLIDGSRITDNHKEAIIETREKVNMPRVAGSICEGDTIVVERLLQGELAEGIFDKVEKEVLWQTMSHRGGDVPRLVAVQCEIAPDGSVPIYRHPADEAPPSLPFSPTVTKIRAEVERQIGHSLNHVLIQLYRGGQDFISEHSDKTLDIAPDTFIVNVSLGAQRTMVFREKPPLRREKSGEGTTAGPPRNTQRVPLPHNSMCKMGLSTNMRWTHSIRKDGRMAAEKSDAELAFHGARISLTFRKIATFLSQDQQLIWGQGATSKMKERARPVINGDTTEYKSMIEAFGAENRASNFDWQEHYGVGFDLLHILDSPKLALSGDGLIDLKIKLLLANHKILWKTARLPHIPELHSSSVIEPPLVQFVDNDAGKSTVGF